MKKPPKGGFFSVPSKASFLQDCDNVPVLKAYVNTNFSRKIIAYLLMLQFAGHG